MHAYLIPILKCGVSKMNLQKLSKLMDVLSSTPNNVLNARNKDFIPSWSHYVIKRSLIRHSHKNVIKYSLQFFGKWTLSSKTTLKCYLLNPHLMIKYLNHKVQLGGQLRMVGIVT